MADPVDLACFIAQPEDGQLYLIYEAIAGGGGIADNVNVTNTCLDVQPCEGAVFDISAATLPLPTGAATEATLVKLPVAQASATAGESGPLVQGAVTTSNPTYVTGNTNPLSLTTAGELRVITAGSGVQQTPSRSIETVTGSVAAGATSVTILSSSDFSGTVLTANFLPSLAETYEAADGNTLAAIAYTITAGSLTITKVV